MGSSVEPLKSKPLESLHPSCQSILSALANFRGVYIQPLWHDCALIFARLVHPIPLKNWCSTCKCIAFEYYCFHCLWQENSLLSLAQCISKHWAPGFSHLKGSEKQMLIISVFIILCNHQSAFPSHGNILPPNCRMKWSQLRGKEFE